MDINTYLEQTYRWMQTLYTPETLDALVKRIGGWLEGMTLERAGSLLLWISAAAVLVDLVLYWTRKDQVRLLRRVVSAVMKLWDRLTIRTQQDSAAE